MVISWRHLKISGLVRNLFYVAAGKNYCRKHKVPFGAHFPSALNSMATVWNFSQLNLAPFGTLIDVGANNGQMAKLLLAMSPGAKVLAFEPLPDCTPVGELSRYALSDENGRAKMFLSTEDNYGASLGNSDAPHDKVLEVETRRFDSLGIAIASLPKPVLLKVDTEGHEMRVLRGFGEELKHVDVLLLEVQNTQYAGLAPDALDTYSFLKSQGFTKSRALFSWFDGVNPPAYMDVLFWRG